MNLVRNSKKCLISVTSVSLGLKFREKLIIRVCSYKHLYLKHTETNKLKVKAQAVKGTGIWEASTTEQLTWKNLKNIEKFCPSQQSQSCTSSKQRTKFQKNSWIQGNQTQAGFVRAMECLNNIQIYDSQWDIWLSEVNNQWWIFQVTPSSKCLGQLLCISVVVTNHWQLHLDRLTET